MNYYSISANKTYTVFNSKELLWGLHYSNKKWKINSQIQIQIFHKVSRIERDENTTGHMNTDLAESLGYDRIGKIKEKKAE